MRRFRAPVAERRAGSYGGYWLHRFLDVEPELADGAIFESSSQAVPESGYAGAAKAPYEAGQRLFELCALDSECSARLGSDPFERAHEIWAQLPACAALDYVDAERLPWHLGWAIDRGPLYRVVPAFLHRLARCSDADVSFVQRFVSSAAEPLDLGPQERFSDALHWHIPVLVAHGGLDAVTPPS